MLTNNDNAPFTPSELAQARNRWVGSLRTLLLGLDPAVHQPVGDAEPMFVGGDPLNVNILQVITAYLRANHEVSNGAVAELVYAEFDVAHSGEPRAVHVIGLRDGLFLVKRDCRLWLDRDGRGAVLARPDRRGGHFVHEDGELVNLPGQPACKLALGFARARTRLAELADAMSDSEAAYCFAPRRRAA